jgi:hypothetical protein
VGSQISREVESVGLNLSGTIRKLAAVWFLCLSTLIFAGSNEVAPQRTSIDQGFRQMYDLQFDAAHQTFSEHQRVSPADPMGPASNAAAYLFAEFDRLHILESELFVNDDSFENREKPVADPNVKRNFDAEIAKANQLIDVALAKNPKDPNALFARVLVYGLNSDYIALIEKHDLKALSVVKEGRKYAENLLAVDPNCYDAYIAVGVENYLLSLKPAPVRWFLKITGAQTDKQTGIANLQLTAEKGRYLQPYARMLLAVAAIRDKDTVKAKALLQGLSQEFPRNHLYAKELAKLNVPKAQAGNVGTP